jgi:PIN domain nuclease of toxin-antitoxin system
VRYLLDSHAFLWWMAGDDRLPASVKALMLDDGSTLFLSAASAWEIAIKAARGRLRLPLPVDQYLALRSADDRIEPLEISFGHVLVAAALPPIHRDPFDRVLVAQAQTLGCPILTGDPEIARYAVDVVW